LAAIQQAALNWPEPVRVERAVVGVFFTGVKLSNGHAGVCFTPLKNIPEAVCCPSSARTMPASGRLRGREAMDLAREGLDGGPLQKALAISTLNALSSACLASETAARRDLRIGVDPINLLRLEPDIRVVVVGALVPYLRALKARGRPFHVLEQDPATLKADELPFFVPAERAAEVVPQADVLILTGTTLLTATLEGLLALAQQDACVIVVGPTASLLLEALFRRGVSVVAGIRVTQPDVLLETLAEGGSGYHFFGQSAVKTALFNPDRRRKEGACSTLAES
jgi:uncharacterized protein (DUF4213/DUF364 family)